MLSGVIDSIREFAAGAAQADERVKDENQHRRNDERHADIRRGVDAEVHS